SVRDLPWKILLTSSVGFPYTDGPARHDQECREKESAMTENTVRSNGRRWLGFFLGVAAAGMLVHLVLTTAAWAQGRGGLRANTRHANRGTVRTVKEMLAFDATHPDIPVAVSPSLPTMNFGQYHAAKAAAAADVGPQAGLGPSPAGPPIA